MPSHNETPLAIILPAEQEVIVGAIVRLDGRASVDTETSALTYSWSFTQVPIGSQVERHGFNLLESDSSVVSFTPDITGTYKVQLVVSDGSLSSIPVTAIVDTRIILVPHHTGFVPDASFIWDYLSDFWRIVDGRKRFEVFWSSAIQIVSSELLKLYQYDYNKSIRDIQEVVQKRWVPYEFNLALDSSKVTFILAEDQAGSNASTTVVDPVTSEPLLAQPSYVNLVSVPSVNVDFELTSFSTSVLPGRLLRLGNRSYTHTRASRAGSRSVFFGDLTAIPSGLENQDWRFSSTLSSSEYDFELQGVTEGDILEVEIERVDTPIVATLLCQIVSVDRNRVGFVLNLKDLVTGTSGGYLSDDGIVELAAGLQVPGVLLSSIGRLSFEGQAEVIFEVLKTQVFKRANFEVELTATSHINIGPFNVTARPVKIIRNSRVPVSPDLMSVPILQEYLKQPEIAYRDGQIVLISNGVEQTVSRVPYLLSENLDFVIDDHTSITGVCNINAGTDEVSIPFGDMMDRSVREQDSIVLTIAFRDTEFKVRRVLSPTLLRVWPVPEVTALGVPFRVVRRVSGKYLRFAPNVFSKVRPAPIKLWGEVSYFDNNEAVEHNFGVLVGVTRENLKTAGITTSYKSAVSGLMYALVKGPTIANLELSAQILLGFPFTRNAGVISEINPIFRKRLDGSPIFGRILVEGRDTAGNPSGVTDVYLYNHGRQLPDPSSPGNFIPALPEFSGIATNPVTKVPFAVGDSVGQFVPLAKGVLVREYISTPEWVTYAIAQGNKAALVQQYHSFQVTVNADLLSTADADFTAQFVTKVKPHYLRGGVALLKATEDAVAVGEAVQFKRLMSLFDIPGQSLPSALKFDSKDEDDTVLSVEGQVYSRYLSGVDLVTTYGSASVTSAAGGFLTARPALVESHDTPLLRPGDLLAIRGGPNKGRYTVSSATSNTALVLALSGAAFQSLVGQHFIVYRPLRNPIWVGTVVVTNLSDRVVVQEADGTPGGIGSAGVAVGDFLVFADLTVATPTVSAFYRIVEVAPDSLSPLITISPNTIAAPGTFSAWVIRESLMTRGLVSPYGVTSVGFTASATLHLPYINFTGSVGATDWLNVACIQPGDRVELQGTTYTVLRNEPNLRRVLVTPKATVDVVAEQASVMLRPYAGTTPVSSDFSGRTPSDNLEVTVVSSLLSTDKIIVGLLSVDVVSTESTDFAVDLLVRPNDHLVLLDGPDSLRNVGHGLGAFLIREVSGQHLHLADVLLDAGEFRYAIRRKIPYEG